MAQRKGYIYTGKKHSDKAVMAAVLGFISFCSLGAMLYLSGRRAGEVHAGYGIGGILVVLYSLVGLCLGIVTVKEKESFHLFSWLGILFSALSLAGAAWILYLGL